MAGCGVGGPSSRSVAPMSRPAAAPMRKLSWELHAAAPSVKSKSSARVKEIGCHLQSIAVQNRHDGDPQRGPTVPCRTFVHVPKHVTFRASRTWSTNTLHKCLHGYVLMIGAPSHIAKVAVNHAAHGLTAYLVRLNRRCRAGREEPDSFVNFRSYDQA